MVDDGGRFSPSFITAVAIDKDKNSQQAVKWTVDHLLINTPRVVLIHVRPRSASSGSSYGTPGSSFATEVSSEAGREQPDSEVNQLYLPYRGFCARKGMQMKEVVMEDTDISKAIVDYIITNNIQNIVVGASNRNVITRKFRNPDVPSCLMKSVPDFCAVYVISKGKPITVRSAKSTGPISAIPPRQANIQASPWPVPDYEDSMSRAPRGTRGSAPASPQQERRSFERFSDHGKMASARDNRPLSTARSAPNNFIDILDSSTRPPRLSDYNDSSFSDDGDFYGSMGSMDFGHSLEFSSASADSPRASSASSAANRDVEAEMRRLKLELKQTMDMYSTACKEAITAKQKAKELNQWKVEESRKFEELRSAEEAALAIAEMEKVKCKAAIEAAEAAQRIAELEAQKRINAERKAKREAEEKKKALDALAHNDVRYRKYSIEEIEVATENFTESLKIGEGGYGPVYRACLDHTPVAIKVLRPDAAQGRKQFQQEVEVLCCIRHPNMVLLLGACPEYGCLVYEYMDSGSLDDRLFRRGNTPPIPWRVRFRIAAEIATALLFLHQTKPEPLVHRDLKPANILLDRNYTSKISDVGLARLVPPSVADTVTQYHMTSTAGTFCYIDPEYQQTGMLGTKSDVYSLGIMLLQIITAKPPMGLTHHVERAIERGKFEEMLDPTIDDWPVEEALSFAKLSLKCAELRRKDRPDLGTVVLPELNRLRNLGRGYDSKNYGSSTSSSSVSRPHSYDSQTRSRTSLSQEQQNSEENMRTAWMSAPES